MPSLPPENGCTPRPPIMVALPLSGGYTQRHTTGRIRRRRFETLLTLDHRGRMVDLSRLRRCYAFSSLHPSRRHLRSGVDIVALSPRSVGRPFPAVWDLYRPKRAVLHSHCRGCNHHTIL
jgi:hypothetical protein